ncbi:MAG TPA: contractile injection system tape measure protein [Candidatus Deferrimicrobium sp.]|nr:contractile injection system tape measure protein [Candidatus Deferrimicrobium sp.]
MANDTTDIHRIRKAVFDLTFPDEKTAFRLRKRLEEMFYIEVVPVLDEVFSTLAPNGQVYRIKRLEIDLGRFDPEQLDGTVIRRAILTQLGDYLRDFVSREAKPEPVEVSVEQVLSRFLDTGELVWYSVHDSVTTLERAIRALEPAVAQGVIRRIVPTLRRRHARLRLIYQFSSGFCEWVIRMLHPTTWQGLFETGRDVLGPLKTTEAKDVLLSVAAGMLPDESIDPTVFAVRVRELGVFAVRVKELGALDVPVRKSAEQSTARSRSQDVRTEDIHQEKEADEENAKYVRYAGIVLLHPFLARFFDALSLLDDNQHFTSDESRARAVHLMYYLATRREEPPENETVLFKILCGYSLQTPLVKQLRLTQREKDEAENLLTSAIRLWQKLGNTSPDGFREGFLQRQGKLTQTGNSWHLAVEQSSIDILLDHLPWSLSILTLPWLEVAIRVDWA